jgi:hypothetical protein
MTICMVLLCSACFWWQLSLLTSTSDSITNLIVYIPPSPLISILLSYTTLTHTLHPCTVYPCHFLSLVCHIYIFNKAMFYFTIESILLDYFTCILNFVGSGERLVGLYVCNDWPGFMQTPMRGTALRFARARLGENFDLFENVIFWHLFFFL